MRLRWIVLFVAIVLALTAGSARSGGLECRGGFPWGHQCWTHGEGSDFARWLAVHGSSAQRFKENYPQLARVFDRPWPAPPYWKTCLTGYQCAVAVIGRIFGGDISYEMSIVSCETGGTYSNRSLGSAGERGWWQIHPVHFGSLNEDRLWDVRYNTRVAWRMSSGGTNFGPWTCA